MCVCMWNAQVCDRGRGYHMYLDLINYSACINLHLSVCLPTYVLGQWWAAGCQQKRLSFDLCELWGEKYEWAKRRGIRGEKKESTLWVSQQDITLLLSRWWIPPMQQQHNYIHPFLPCQQEHWSLTVLGQAAEIMQEVEPRRWPPANFEVKHINKIHQ